MASCLGLGLLPAGPSEVWAATDSGPGSPGLSNHTPVWVALALAFITRMAPAVCLQLWPCLSALVRTSPLRVQQTPAPPVPLRQGCPARFSSHTHVSVPRAQRPSRDDFSRIQPVSLPRTLGLGWAGLVGPPPIWAPSVHAQPMAEAPAAAGGLCIQGQAHTPLSTIHLPL